MNCPANPSSSTTDSLSTYLIGQKALYLLATKLTCPGAQLSSLDYSLELLRCKSCYCLPRALLG